MLVIPHFYNEVKLWLRTTKPSDSVIKMACFQTYIFL